MQGLFFLAGGEDGKEGKEMGRGGRGRALTIVIGEGNEC